jgi:hypothetical protein
MPSLPVPARVPPALRSLSLGLLITLAACDDLDTPPGGEGSAEPGPHVPMPPVDFDPAADAPYSGRTAIGVRFEPAVQEFYALPWPHDARRTPRGTPAMQTFPNPGQIDLLDEYVAVIERDIRGFATQPVHFVALDGPLPEGTLPQPPDTVTDQAPVQLVRLLPDGCGERVPLQVDQVGAATEDPYLVPHVLRAGVLNGWVLEPGATYALLVMRSLGAEGGATVGVPAAMRAAIRGEHPDPALNAAYAPLVPCLRSGGVDASQIAVAAVYTTQDPVAETLALRRAALEDANPPVVQSWAWRQDRSTGQYTTWGGTFLAPIFQNGSTPYAVPADGGAFVFGEDGRPLIQRYEAVPFAISWRTGAVSSGLPQPVMLWQDGTAVNSPQNDTVQYGHVGGTPFRAAIEAGFVVVNFQPQFHAGRSGGSADAVIHSFNFLNPQSGRSAFRQQVIDTVSFVRLLREGADHLPGMPALDLDRLVFGGHSQGAIIGAMVAGIDDSFRGFFLNGVGAVLGTVITERTDPLDINALLSAVLQAPDGLDPFHPVVQLAQLGAESVDPANYAPRWRGWADHPAGNHVLMTNGFRDSTTYHTQISAITILGDAAPLAPAGWEVDPWGLWNRSPQSPPLQGNRRSLAGTPLTLASLLVEDQGHFTIYRVAAAMRMGVRFWTSALGGVPEVVY